MYSAGALPVPPCRPCASSNDDAKATQTRRRRRRPCAVLLVLGGGPIFISTASERTSYTPSSRRWMSKLTCLYIVIVSYIVYRWLQYILLVIYCCLYMIQSIMHPYHWHLTYSVASTLVRALSFSLPATTSKAKNNPFCSPLPHPHAFLFQRTFTGCIAVRPTISSAFTHMKVGSISCLPPSVLNYRSLRLSKC